MMYDVLDLVLGVSFGLIFGFISGGVIGMGIGEEDIQKVVIERGFAHYCPLTGDFAWKGECDG